MMNLGFKLFIVLGFILSMFSACSGGGSSSTLNEEPLPAAVETSLSSVSGIISDGPISKAKVFIDLNLNTAFDSGEPYSITDENGFYKIDYILDSEKTYMLVAFGNTALSTIDPLDNPGIDLNFIMFDEFQSVKNESSTNIKGTIYQKDIKPSSFKNYLSRLNDESYGTLDINNSIINQLINVSSDTDETELFKNYILNRENEIKIKLQEVVEKIIQVNSATQLQSTQSIVNIPSTSNIVISDENSSDLAKTLFYQDKTTPSKIGSLAISKNLELYKKIEEFNVFITKYTSILEIPDYKMLSDSNYTIIDGADVHVSLNGIVKEEDETVALDIMSNYTFAQSDQRVDLLQYIGLKWTVKESNITVESLNSKLIDLAPFVIVKRSAYTNKTYQISNFETFLEPVVIVQGNYIDTSSNSFMSGDDTVLNFTELAVDGSVNVSIPDGFVVKKIVVFSQELADVTPTKIPYVVLEVEDNSVVQNQDSITSFKSVTNEDELSLILSGDLMSSSVGLASMINTKILYKHLLVGLNLVDNGDAKDILLTNVNNFLGGNNIFDSSSEDRIIFGSTEVSIDSAKKSISLSTNNYDGNNALIDNISVVWDFTNNRVKRTFIHKYYSGTKKDSLTTSTYTFIYKGENNEIVANFDEQVSDKTLYENYSDSLIASYAGIATFQRNSNDDSISKVLNSKFTQMHTQKNNKGSENYLNGIVSTYDINTTLDPLDNKLSFEGEFLLQNSLYEAIEGSVKVDFFDANTTKGLINNNSISKALVLTNYFTPIASNGNFIGNWEGSFTNSCSTNNGSLYIDFETSSWYGSTNYGTSLSVESNIVKLYDNENIWATMQMNGESLSGTWSLNECNGDVSLSKQ